VITIRDLADRIGALASRLDGLPQFRWGRVETVKPLSVVLDAETNPIVGVGAISQVSVGDRVLVLLWNRRATVLGAARTETELQLSGVWDQPSGGWGVTSLTNEQGTWRGTFSMDLPFPLPEGYTVVTSVVRSSGITLVQTSNTKTGSTRVEMRFVQISNGDTMALRSVAWQLVKI
jgi:hypothetical protein